MPIRNFDDQTFVAFTDISGFKALMAAGRGEKAIHDFYASGYAILRDENEVNGFFVSDCGVLFSTAGSKKNKLDSLLRVLVSLNRRVLRHRLMLTTSVAWGRFSYHTRVEFDGIAKQPIYGNAYLDAFMDNEAGRPKMKPGQMRIVKKTLGRGALQSQYRPLMEETDRHFNFYWNVNSPEEISGFKNLYSDGYNRQYLGMMSALRAFSE